MPYIAQNGVQVSRGATATVDGNRIADNFYTGSADAISCGLLLFEADGVKQKRNVFVANEQDLCNFGRGGGGSAELGPGQEVPWWPSCTAERRRRAATATSWSVVAQNGGSEVRRNGA